MDLVLKKDAKVEAASEQIHDTTKITYTCPMHPDVNSDQPGLCPDCNMNLEPKKPEPAPRDTAKGRSDLPQYTCGMHPQIVSNEPGLCPICNMNLVPKSDVSLSGGQIMVDAATQKKMGLATTTASYRNLNKTIRAYGNVTYSEPDLFTVNLKIAGWVEKLYVNETGAKVTKGEPLLEIYSPELVAAQQECLIAWQSMQAMHAGDSVPTRLIDASFQKLKNWDISDEQIQKLMTTKKATRTLILTSPFDGVVTFKSVSEGDYILPGQDLYKIANLSTVWVSAFIFEQDLPLVNKGLNATVSSPSMPNNSFDSEIIYVSPFLNENRQAEIRLAVINDKLLLKPNMYAEVNIKKPLASTNLTVPRSALIKSGTREIVFVIAGQNLFQAREVHSGILSDQDYVEILHGLKAGEEVVTSGQFMLDSESRLQEALAENSRDKSATAAGHVH
jgi:Cu(I)/Ag(I) efflux system membrane fusion protein/cobalt-zinc-cadmium efflux system membrane fusion protein